MRFPIDALFVGAARRRRRPARGGESAPALRPWRGLVMPVKGAEGVLELPAGAVERAGLSVGDAVRLVAARAGPDPSRGDSGAGARLPVDTVGRPRSPRARLASWSRRLARAAGPGTAASVAASASRGGRAPVGSHASSGSPRPHHRPRWARNARRQQEHREVVVPEQGCQQQRGADGDHEARLAVVAQAEQHRARCPGRYPPYSASEARSGPPPCRRTVEPRSRLLSWPVTSVTLRRTVM